MTLEEAKKRIAQYVCKCRRDYNTYGDEHVKGEEYGLRHALSILKQVDTKPAPKDSMTLTELAHELRKILPRTRYVTVGNHPSTTIVDNKIVSVFYERDGRYVMPEYNRDSMHPNTWGIKHPKLKVYGEPFYAKGDHQFYFCEVVNLNLSEYADADGNIDYSKCIVEVEK